MRTATEEERKEIFKKGFPAVTFVEVSHLARPQLIMEIQPIAVIP